ncbi:MAG: glycoside hydrolase family 3 C-terminal domain-containing protein [Candidatus Lokiarchaeota archaeon]
MPSKEKKTLPYFNEKLDLEERVNDLLERLTIEEKFKLCAGHWLWKTKKVKRLGIKSFKMTDGPHGVGALGSWFKKCTYFPVAICRAATWNPKLSYKFGEATAQEVRDIGYHMLLAPGINIDRSPLCGRTFEYQTEDPYLNSILAYETVNGIQSERIAACVKHFACNNQEVNRFRVSVEVSERALQEIYLPAFKSTVKKSNAWSFMACYNKIKGTYGCESKEFLKERLMNQWGFKGFVVSDWLATRHVESTSNCVNAGLSLEMPRSIVYKKKLLRKSFNNNEFSEETLNNNVKRLLRVMFSVGLFDSEESIPKGSRNTKEHQMIARKIAEEGIVLLKNQRKLLPLQIENIKKVAILGPNSDKKMALGGGSSMVRAYYEITPLKGLESKLKEKVEIIDNPKEADYTLIFVGLDHGKYKDKENYDRKGLSLPEDQIDLIKETAKITSNLIVILINGSPLSMESWIEDVPVIIEAWYAGMESGNVIADILFGDINPSGKLPITFPKNLSDTPAHKSAKAYPGKDKVYYEEDIYVGYRHFDQSNIKPLFPFGYGLSYTEFLYEKLSIEKKKIEKENMIKFFLDISNIGDKSGSEVVQVYIKPINPAIRRPPKELKAFKKIYLKSKEKQTISFEMETESLAYFNDKENKWKIDKGIYKILIGSSSRDIRLEDEIEYVG